MSANGGQPSAEPDIDDAFWWEALAEGRLLLPFCHACGRSWMRPTPTCPHCGCTEWAAREVSGNGSLYSWVTAAVAFDPSLAGDIPYVVGVVELDGGARVHARVLAEAGLLRAGARMRVTAGQAGANGEQGTWLVARMEESE